MAEGSKVKNEGVMASGRDISLSEMSEMAGHQAGVKEGGSIQSQQW